MSGEVYFGEVDVRRFDRVEGIDVLRRGLIDIEVEISKHIPAEKDVS